MPYENLWSWAVFAVVVIVFLAFDLFAHADDRPEGRKRAWFWVILSVGLGLGFGGYVWASRGQTAGEEYLAAYLLEKCLSLDNLFVFLVIFRMLRIPAPQQRVALSWGVLGALVFRAIFIFLGVELLERWRWVELVFAGLLLYGAWHAFRESSSEQDEDNALVRWLTRHLPIGGSRSETHFVVREQGRLVATPLLVAVLAIEASDVLFAIDSVPAAFSVTHDRFVIYTSNVFAILGLRSLFVVLAHALTGLQYLHYGLAAVLAFAGGKMILAFWHIAISPAVSVGLIVALIGTAVAASLTIRPSNTPHK